MRRAGFGGGLRRIRTLAGSVDGRNNVIVGGSVGQAGVRIARRGGRGNSCVGSAAGSRAFHSVARRATAGAPGQTDLRVSGGSLQRGGCCRRLRVPTAATSAGRRGSASGKKKGSGNGAHRCESAQELAETMHERSQRHASVPIGSYHNKSQQDGQQAGPRDRMRATAPPGFATTAGMQPDEPAQSPGCAREQVN